MRNEGLKDVVFSKPNTQQYLMVADYYARVLMDTEAKGISDAWQYYIAAPAYILVSIFMLILFMRFRTILLLPVTLLLLFGLYCVAYYYRGYVTPKKVEKVSSAEFEIARVAFSDATYSRNRKNNNYRYYVCVSENGESMRLRVAEHVYVYALSRQKGEGYLIKNSDGDGIYDVYDFIPDENYE